MILIGRGLDLIARVDVLSGHLPVQFSRCDRLSWRESSQVSEPKSEVSRKVSRAEGEQSEAEELKNQQDREHTISGDNSLRDPPVPIPNTEVKPQHADGTWLETARESRSSPDSNKFIVVNITMICLSSSMAEHSAVNRRVVGSSPT